MPTTFQIDDYVTQVFIETGCGAGDTISKALHAGFYDVYGIEGSPTLNSAAHQRIQDEISRLPSRANVFLYGGASPTALQDICEKTQNKRASILLNLQSAEDGVARPVLDEIRVLQRWFRDALMPPAVLIRGIRQDTDAVSGPQFRPSLDSLITALLDLCEGYQFQILDDDRGRNVLAALPPPRVQAQW